MFFGAVAQLARAPALQAGCQGFESLQLHQSTLSSLIRETLSFDWLCPLKVMLSYLGVQGAEVSCR